MDFMTAVKTCFSKYFTIQGRAQRSEYWWYALFTFIVAIIATGIDSMIGALYILYLFVTRGTEGENNFGPDPLA